MAGPLRRTLLGPRNLPASAGAGPAPAGNDALATGNHGRCDDSDISFVLTRGKATCTLLPRLGLFIKISKPI